jgi:hypothetical protein
VAGPALAVRVVNTARGDHVGPLSFRAGPHPVAPEYDLRELQPLKIDDDQYETAKAISNRRTTSTADLTEDDVTTELEPLPPDGQMQVFVTAIDAW